MLQFVFLWERVTVPRFVSVLLFGVYCHMVSHLLDEGVATAPLLCAVSQIPLGTVSPVFM